MTEPYYDDGQVQRSALAEANSAKTHCPSGHPYSDGNTYVRPKDGARLCRECNRASGRATYAARKAAVRAANASIVTLPTGCAYLDSRITATPVCWPWNGAVSDSGYGIAKINRRNRPAHRVVYEFLMGPVDPLLDLDHLCRNRSCCNPDHLEPVTRKVNVLRGAGAAARNARKTECLNGHPLSGDNLVPWAQYRMCRLCERGRAKIKARARRARVRTASAVGS